jgi:mannose-6-phosphate isomerase-like protein (cupin superfamily)
VESIHQFKPESELLTDEGCYVAELRNIEADPNCSIARARVKPGVKTKLHCLRRTVERYVILEGIGEVEIGDAPPVSVARFDVVYIPAGVSQRIRNIGSMDLIFLCVCTPRFRLEAYEKLED